MKKHAMLATILFVSLALCLLSTYVKAQDEATIWTDKADYSPEETVTIFGTGFLPESPVTVEVTRPDLTIDSWNVTSELDGNFTTTYSLDGITGTYTVTVTDGINTATTTFTDAIQVDTTTTLNAISGPLTPGQTGVSYSGKVLASPAVPNGQTVKLQISTDNLNFADIATTTTTSGNGMFSGTFTMPSAALTYYFRALFPATGVIGGYNWKQSKSDVQTMYKVLFAVNPSGSGSTSPSITAYYNDGYIIDPLTATPTAGYAFSSWSVSTTTGTITIADTSYASTTATIHGTGTISANFVVATATITFYQTGVGTDFTGAVLTIDGTAYLGVGDFDGTKNVFTWNIGSSHTFAYASPLVVTANSKQYVWTSTAGLSTSQSGSITVAGGGGSVTGNYKTQYYLTVTTNFGSVSPASDWHDAGSKVTISATAPAAGAGEQYVWNGWAGSGAGSYTGMDNPATDAVTMNGPITETASWTHQYLLTIQTSGLSSASYPTNVKLDGSTVGTAYDSSAYTKWFDANDPSGTIGVDATVSGGAGTQFVFTKWNEDSSTDNPRASVAMNGPKTFTAVYKTQYKVSFAQSGSAVAPTVDYTADTDPTGIVPFDVWVKAGTEITYTYQDIVYDPTPSIRYVLIGVSPASPQTVNGPLTVTGTYKTQYHLRVSTFPTGLNPQPTVTLVLGYDSGGGWYDTGSVVSIDPDSPAGYTFDHWKGDVSGNAVPLSVTMSSAKDIVAVFTFNLAVESGFKAGDSPSFASDPFLNDILCVLQKATTNSYKLVGTSPGTYDYAISIKNTGTTTFNSITIIVTGNEDHYLKSSNPIRVLDSNGNVITSQFTITGTWPTITIASNSAFQGLPGSASLYVTIHLDYTKKGSTVSTTQFYGKGYTFTTEVEGTSGPNTGDKNAYDSVAFLSKKVTIIYGFVKTSSGVPIEGATIELWQNDVPIATGETDADGFYCFIDGVDGVKISGGVAYTVKCTPPTPNSPPYSPPPPQSQSVIAKKDADVTVNFVVKDQT